MSDRHIEYLALDELLAAPRNPKDHNLDTLGASINLLGFIEPIVIDERTGRLVSGHGRVEELRRQRDAGASPPDGLRDDWATPVVRGWASRSDVEAERALVALNAIGQAGGWDPELLVASLQAIADTAAGLEGVGFTDANLADLLATLGPIPTVDDLDAAHGPGGPDDLWPVLTIRVPPELKTRWERVTAGHGELAHERLAWLLDAVTVAAAVEGP